MTRVFTLLSFGHVGLIDSSSNVQPRLVSEEPRSTLVRLLSGLGGGGQIPEYYFIGPPRVVPHSSITVSNVADPCGV